jgi:hypothetical protein
MGLGAPGKYNRQASQTECRFHAINCKHIRPFLNPPERIFQAHRSGKTLRVEAEHYQYKLRFSAIFSVLAQAEKETHIFRNRL